MGVKDLDQLGEIGERAGQSVDLVDRDDIDPARPRYSPASYVVGIPTPPGNDCGIAEELWAFGCTLAPFHFARSPQPGIKLDLSPARPSRARRRSLAHTPAYVTRARPDVPAYLRASALPAGVRDNSASFHPPPKIDALDCPKDGLPTPRG
jgi:hypothetical protein